MNLPGETALYSTEGAVRRKDGSCYEGDRPPYDTGGRAGVEKQTLSFTHSPLQRL